MDIKLDIANSHNPGYWWVLCYNTETRWKASGSTDPTSVTRCHKCGEWGVPEDVTELYRENGYEGRASVYALHRSGDGSNSGAIDE